MPGTALGAGDTRVNKPILELFFVCAQCDQLFATPWTPARCVCVLSRSVGSNSLRPDGL